MNVGESVTLEMRSVNPPTSAFRWRHNSGPFIDRSRDGLTHIISNACLGDAGVYECHVYEVRHLQLHGIMRLIVRGKCYLFVQQGWFSSFIVILQLRLKTFLSPSFHRFVNLTIIRLRHTTK